MGWERLDAELAAWRESGRRPRLWWRDDDIEAPTEALDRLLALRDDSGIPLVLAVIPATARSALGPLLMGRECVHVVQHGYDHANHALPDAKKAEFPAGRSRVKVVAQLNEGAARLRSLFGEAFTPVLVPPWNRIDDSLVAVLPQAGYLGLSAFAGPHAPRAVRDLGRADCHVDTVEWRGSRAFVGLGAALDQAVAALAAERAWTGPERAVGLLTHHRDMDEAGWDFTREFIRRTGSGGGHWTDVGDALVFGE